MSASIEKLAATDSLLLAIGKARPRERREIQAMVVHYVGEFRRTAKLDPSGLSVAYTEHCMIDEAVAEQQAHSTDSQRIKCRKGCASCCRTFVFIWPGEAKLLLEVAAEQAIPIDRARLARQTGHSAANWHELAQEDQACVFLGADGACRVYQHRPGACRKHFSAGDPEHCDTVRHPGHQVMRWVSLHAEGIHSAAMTVYRGSGMADELLKAMQA